jgi:hypothetical protein
MLNFHFCVKNPTGTLSTDFNTKNNSKNMTFTKSWVKANLKPK